MGEHLMIAEEAREAYSLDRVLFIPSYITPHKEVHGATAQQRLEMTRLATADNPYFTVSDMEIRRRGPSYTLDTLRFLKKLYGYVLQNLVFQNCNNQQLECLELYLQFF